jgi:transcriptional regulator with XRE-family HTH domain
MFFVEIEDLGPMLKSRRIAAGKTIAAVAMDAALSVPYIANLENGRGNPTVAALSALARALGTRLHVALGDESAPATVVPAALAQFARGKRLAAAFPDRGARERAVLAMAAMATLSTRELSEVDCHRLLDAIVLMRI